MMGFGVGFGFLGLLFMFLFWGILILFAVWLVRAIFSGHANSNSSMSSPRKNSDANEILDQRYARGEITREQYEVMKQDII